MRHLRNEFYLRINPRSRVSVGAPSANLPEQSADSEVLLLVKHGWGRAGSEIDRQTEIDGRIGCSLSIRRDYWLMTEA